MSASIWFMSKQTFVLCILRWKSISPLKRWNFALWELCLCLGSPTGQPVSKAVLCWTADVEEIIFCVCHMHTYTAGFWGKTCGVNSMTWSPICVQTLCFYILHQTLCAPLVPCKLCFFHINMQRYIAVWHSSSFKRILGEVIICIKFSLYTNIHVHVWYLYISGIFYRDFNIYRDDIFDIVLDD